MKNDKLIEFIETTLKEGNFGNFLVELDEYFDFVVIGIYFNLDGKKTKVFSFFDNGTVHCKNENIVLDIHSLEAIHKICVVFKNNIFN